MLAKLRARLKELLGVLKALTEKAELTAEELKTLTDSSKEATEVEAQITQLEAAEAIIARGGRPADQQIGADTVAATVKQPTTASEKIGVMVFCMAKVHKDTGMRGPAATFDQMDKMGYGAVAKEFAKVRALNSSSPAAGGVLVPDDMSSEIIPILRPRSTFLAGGPRPTPLVNGSYKLPAAASGATSGWRGEGRPISASQPTFKDINLTAKFLDSLVPLTNQLIRWSLPDVKAWVEQDMADSMGAELDRAAYFGSGTINEPLGVLNIPGVGSTAALGGLTPTVAQIETGCLALELGMMNKNVDVTRAAWRMSPRVFGYLSNLRDANGNRYFPELQDANPRFRNKPVMFTTQFPINGGGTTDESTIALIKFDDILYGESSGLSFAVSTEATYVKNGVTVSAFQNDLTLIKASLETDVDMRYLESVQKLTNVRWGA